MNKILIFYGSNRAFLEECPTSFRNLTDVVAEVDDNSKNMILHIPAVEKETQEVEKKPKIKIENFVINSDEYSGVREHVIINFANFIANMVCI